MTIHCEIFDGVNFDQPVSPGEEWARVRPLEIFRASRHYLNEGWVFGTSEYKNEIYREFSIDVWIGKIVLIIFRSSNHFGKVAVKYSGSILSKTTGVD